MNNQLLRVDSTSDPFLRRDSDAEMPITVGPTRHVVPRVRLLFCRRRCKPWMVLFSQAVLLIGMFLFFILLSQTPADHELLLPRFPNLVQRYLSLPKYNDTYPLTHPVEKPWGRQFRIAVVADLDTNSRVADGSYEWYSVMKTGSFAIDMRTNQVQTDWDSSSITLRSSISYSGRGMELSELVVFNGKLYSCDDRTGIVYEVHENHVIPWTILSDGPGNSSQGFKCEWATVRDGLLFFGGLGKEWTNSRGEVLHYNPQWVKSVSPFGDVQHHDWRKHYIQLKAAAGITDPGYMIHESAMWSDTRKRWIFLPRRASLEPYEERADERRGTNLCLIADSTFESIHVIRIGSDKKMQTKGFSSFKFIPGTNEELIVAIKSEEDDGKTAAYMTVFRLTERRKDDFEAIVILEDVKVDDFKFEGIEFI